VPATVALAVIVMNCLDPAPMAAFYCAAGGGEIVSSDADSSCVRLGGMTLFFQSVEDYRAPTWPSSDVPVQIHMDFRVEDLAEAEEVLRGYGATTAEFQPHGEVARVMLDPAGHPFCIGARASCHCDPHGSGQTACGVPKEAVPTPA